MNRLAKLGPEWQLTLPLSRFDLGPIGDFGNVRLTIISARRDNDLVRHRMYQLDSESQANRFGDTQWQRFAAAYERTRDIRPRRALWLESDKLGPHSYAGLWIADRTVHFLSSHSPDKSRAQELVQIAGIQ